jgi:predicted nucleic acid binding AN1-type Zn finger protein
MHPPSPISRSASPESIDTIQIFIKSVSGDSKHPPPSSSPILTNSHPAIPITVPQDLTIQNLTTLLSVRTSLPESDLRLVHAGKHLSPSQTLSDYRISRESTLHLASRLRGGMPPKKIRCTYKDCKEGAQRIIGDCGFCNGHYCGKHRLLEDHKCDGLEDVSSAPEWWLVGLDLGEWLADTSDSIQCKKESHDRNAAQLNAERTQVIKGI